MKQTIKNLLGFTLGATDGEIGKVTDFYFDDITWKIRYLVLETGNWLSNRKVLISPEALLTCDWANKAFPVNLTKEQIKDSPDIDTDQSVSEQHQMELSAHYAWTNHFGGSIWKDGMGTSGMMMPTTSEPEKDEVKKYIITPNEELSGDSHLRSAYSVQGNTLQATDDTIGEVEDFILDTSNWTIQYLLVDTGNWFPGKKVTISPDLIKEINWENSEVIINASVEQVKNSPEYDASKELSATYEANLQNYYGRFIDHK
jgi:uncharacterized protein YrrD